MCRFRYDVGHPAVLRLLTSSIRGSLGICALVVMAAFVLGCSGHAPNGEPSSHGASAEENREPRGDDDNWPFLARVYASCSGDKLATRRVSAVEVQKTMEHSDWGPSGDLEAAAERARGFVVTSIDGRPVRLEEVADVDVVVVRRVGPLAEEIRRRYAYDVPARIVLDVDAKKLAKTGVDANDVKTVLDRLSPDEQYSLTQIRGLMLRGKDGIAVRLAEIAKVSVELKKESGGGVGSL